MRSPEGRPWWSPEGGGGEYSRLCALLAVRPLATCPMRWSFVLLERLPIANCRVLSALGGPKGFCLLLAPQPSYGQAMFYSRTSLSPSSRHPIIRYLLITAFLYKERSRITWMEYSHASSHTQHLHSRRQCRSNQLRLRKSPR